jgi:hypothetical protein
MWFACWITNITDTHSEYVILIAFPQQWSLCEHVSVLHYSCIVSLVYNFLDGMKWIPWYWTACWPIVPSSDDKCMNMEYRCNVNWQRKTTYLSFCGEKLPITQSVVWPCTKYVTCIRDQKLMLSNEMVKKCLILNYPK